MKISTKGRYGLRAMLDLAVNCIGEQVPLRSIAQRQNISENYLEQVFSSLRKSGLVKSIKGPQGGYVLGRDASSITVGNILRVLEGNFSVSDEEDSGGEFERCLKDNVWQKINDSINDRVDSITLEDLVVEYKKLTGGASYVYYI